jgi:hypothetical protein
MPAQRSHELEPAEERRLYYEGIRLFNAGEFFEAHEVWEDVWHMATGRKYKFYQGLIQAAVSFEHLRRGNRRGCLNLYRTCVGKFDDVPEVFMGLEVLDFLRRVRAGIAHVLDDPEAEVKPRPEKFFQIELQYDPFASPRPTDVP